MRDLAARSLVAVLCAALCACSAYRTTRVVDPRDAAEADAPVVRRAGADSPAALFVDKSPAFVRKGRIETAVVVEPDLAGYLRDALRRASGSPVDHVRVAAVGYRYAYYFPSRHDDFVLEAEVDAPALGVAGTFEGRVRGNERPDWPDAPGADWDAVVPDTGAGLEEDERERRLERRVDQIAWTQRVKLREAARRWVAAVLAARDAR